MKRISLSLIVLSSLTHACPTCVGRIEHDSPAFFQDEFYVPTQEAHTTNLKTPQASEPSPNDETKEEA